MHQHVHLTNYRTGQAYSAAKYLRRIASARPSYAMALIWIDRLARRAPMPSKNWATAISR